MSYHKNQVVIAKSGTKTVCATEVTITSFVLVILLLQHTLQKDLPKYILYLKQAILLQILRLLDQTETIPQDPNSNRLLSRGQRQLLLILSFSSPPLTNNKKRKD